MNIMNKYIFNYIQIYKYYMWIIWEPCAQDLTLVQICYCPDQQFFSVFWWCLQCIALVFQTPGEEVRLDPKKHT